MVEEGYVYNLNTRNYTLMGHEWLRMVANGCEWLRKHSLAQASRAPALAGIPMLSVVKDRWYYLGHHE